MADGLLGTGPLTNHQRKRMQHFIKSGRASFSAPFLPLSSVRFRVTHCKWQTAMVCHFHRCYKLPHHPRCIFYAKGFPANSKCELGASSQFDLAGSARRLWRQKCLPSDFITIPGDSARKKPRYGCNCLLNVAMATGMRTCLPEYRFERKLRLSI